MFYNTFISTIGFALCVINILFICLDNPNIRPYKPDIDLDTCGLKGSLAVSALFLFGLSIAFLTKEIRGLVMDPETTEGAIVVIVVSSIMIFFFHVVGVWEVTDPRNKLDRILRVYVVTSFIGLYLLIMPIITFAVLFIMQTYIIIQGNSKRIGKLLNGTHDNGGNDD